MNVPVLNMAGKTTKKIDLPADIFEYNVNVDLMHQYVLMQEANGRVGTHKTKGRGEINRTHAKWYRQKGTGRARHGNRAAPIFVGGGRAHPRKPHLYTKTMPQKMRHAALKSALSALARDNQLVFVESMKFEQPKAKLAAGVIKALIGDKTALVLLPGRDENAERALSNLEQTYYLHTLYMNVRDLLQYDHVIIPLDSLEVIKGLLGKKAE